MFEDLEYVQSHEKEVDENESEKAKFSNEYDLLLQECVSKEIMSSALHSLADIDEQTELQCLYLEKIEECRLRALEQETRELDVESKQMYDHKASYGVTTPQELRRNQFKEEMS
ncbi:hypothetical protein Tco_1093610 [Tanacetum coccineum]|uniref:Uncharacterized protein n=1 Tax=Tanacetum coccineum TaxID=301880 RepID=A0ABQ5IFK7_9ASTR